MANPNKSPLFRIIWRQQDAVAQLSADSSLFADIGLLRPPERAYPGQASGVDEDQQLGTYCQALVADPAAAELLFARLQAARGTTAVAITQRPVVESRRVLADSPLQTPAERVNPVNDAGTPDYFQLLRHLDPAPIGVDAFAAWDRPGGQGEGVRVVSVENAWNFQHEDLLGGPDLLGSVTGDLIYSDSEDSRDHGTAVLGLLRATPNGRGTCGLVPLAELSVASPTYLDEHHDFVFSLDTALRSLATMLGPGDVVLIELHYEYRHPNSEEIHLVPVSIHEAERAAIRNLVARGIHVIEPAGNGALSLDDPRFCDVFSRENDTGSIMVGAGQCPFSAQPRAPVETSNFGRRVDLQGWGEAVVTTGGRSDPGYCDLRDHPDSSRCYTQSFAGTSSASAIVAGVVASVSGMVRAAGRPPLSPYEMRARLVATGTPQEDVERCIGPLPDLARLIASLSL